MTSWHLENGPQITVERGDLTRCQVDAIVNAANERLLGGGGVDQAIHRAAGSRLLQACRRVTEVRPGIRCPTGEARITHGFDLPAKHVIHTVGPVYKDAATAAPLLRAAHRNSMALARNRGLTTIAFPAISCGSYGYPHDEAAKIAIESAVNDAKNLQAVHFVLFGEATFDAWLKAAAKQLDPLAKKPS